MSGLDLGKLTFVTWVLKKDQSLGPGLEVKDWSWTLATLSTQQLCLFGVLKFYFEPGNWLKLFNNWCY